MSNETHKQTFERWLANHKGLMFKVVRAYAFTSHDQDDLFQEIAIQVWRSIPNFQGDCSETTWIYRVALNSAMAWTRKEKLRRTGREPLEGVEHLLVQTPKFKDSRLGWLYEQIGRLNEVDRSLTLLLLDGFSYREMAAVIGITETHVGVKINRIKKHLSEILRKEQRHEL